jgi:hypothetical protein
MKPEVRDEARVDLPGAKEDEFERDCTQTAFRRAQQLVTRAGDENAKASMRPHKDDRA